MRARGPQRAPEPPVSQGVFAKAPGSGRRLYVDISERGDPNRLCDFPAREKGDGLGRRVVVAVVVVVVLVVVVDVSGVRGGGGKKSVRKCSFRLRRPFFLIDQK